MKSFIVRALCLVLSSLLFASIFSLPILAEAMPTQEILGGQTQTDPLQLTIFADGDLLAAVYQPEQPLSARYAYIPQYKVMRPLGLDDELIEWGSQLTFTAASQEKSLYHNRYYGYSGYHSPQVQSQPFGQASLSSNSDQVTASWDLSAHQLQLRQEVRYQPGSWSFQIRWQLINNGSSAISDLSFIHGGDTDLYGNDSCRADWNQTGQHLLLWPQDPWDSGLMLMGSPSDSAAAHFYGGSYQQLLYYASQPDLPDTVDAQFQESGLQLQWQKSSLQPGETWQFSVWQQFTPPGDIQIIAPQLARAALGSSVALDFTILYIGDSVSRPELSQETSSDSGWSWQGEWSAAEDLSGEPGGFARPLRLNAIVPSAAVDGLLETVELSVRHSGNPWTDYRASGYVLVDSQLAEDPPDSSDQPPAGPAESEQTPSQVTPQPDADLSEQTGKETQEERSPTKTDPADDNHSETGDSHDPADGDGSPTDYAVTESNPDTRDQDAFESAETKLSADGESMVTRVLAALSLSLLAVLIILLIRQQKDRDQSK